MTRITPLLACACFVSLFTIIGCSGEGAGLYEVTGEVTFKGAPLDQGTIRFDPDDPEKCGNGGASIVDGKYTVPKARGLKPGTYTVRISSGNPEKMETPTEAPGQARPVAQDRIPARWNSESTIKVEVVASKNTFSHHIP